MDFPEGMSRENTMTVEHANGEVEFVKIQEPAPPAPAVIQISDEQIDKLAEAFAKALAKAMK